MVDKTRYGTTAHGEFQNMPVTYALVTGGARFIGDGTDSAAGVKRFAEWL